MEGMGGFGDLFGDPDELQKRMAEFAEQLSSQQSLAWADNAIKLAVDMTVAAINRVNVQGTTHRAGRADPHGDGDGLPGGRDARARGPPGPALSQRRRLRAGGAVGLAVRPARGGDVAERAEPEHEEQGAEADAERHDGDRDLLADGVGGDGRAGRGPGEDLDEQRLLHAGAAGGERHERRDGVDAEHEQDVAHRSADPERVEQEPERRAAQQPAGELDEPDLAHVPAPVEQDGEALAHVQPERDDASREPGEQREDAGPRAP